MGHLWQLVEFLRECGFNFVIFSLFSEDWMRSPAQLSAQVVKVQNCLVGMLVFTIFIMAPLPVSIFIELCNVEEEKLLNLLFPVSISASKADLQASVSSGLICLLRVFPFRNSESIRLTLGFYQSLKKEHSRIFCPTPV